MSKGVIAFQMANFEKLCNSLNHAIKWLNCCTLSYLCTWGLAIFFTNQNRAGSSGIESSELKKNESAESLIPPDVRWGMLA